MWSAKPTGGYARESAEGQGNARELANTMAARGWSRNAIAAMLGNGAGESGLNPWRWESDDVPTYARYAGWSASEALNHGYGLFGFTPARRYIEGGATLPGYAPNFADRAGSATDGAAQAQYFAASAGSSWSHGLHDYYADDFAGIGVNIDDFYYMSFQTFVLGNDTIENLVGAFELCYEKPADYAAASSYNYRVEQAKYWLSVLPPVGGLPLWLIAHISNQNRRRVTNGY